MQDADGEKKQDKEKKVRLSALLAVTCSFVFPRLAVCLFVFVNLMFASQTVLNLDGPKLFIGFQKKNFLPYIFMKAPVE